jgi:hemerythrin-like domain-containing protein
MEGLEMQGLDNRTQANAAWMEHQILEHVKNALRVTLDWKVPSVGIPRKLSSVQFTLKSFQRHLERLMDIEEQDGYMVVVAETKPNMSLRIERLELEHDTFREMIRSLLPAVESLSEYQNEEFENICDDIRILLQQIDRHDAEEIDLLQETLLCDEGGEG